MFGPPRWLNVKLMCAVLSWRVGTGGATVSQSKVSVKVSSKWPLSSGAAVAGVLASTVHVMPSPAMISAERRLMTLPAPLTDSDDLNMRGRRAGPR